MNRLVASTAGVLLLFSLHTFFLKAQGSKVPSGMWGEGAAMSVPRSAASAAQLADGRLLVSGGLTGVLSSPEVIRTAEILGANGKFAPAAPMRIARARHASVVLADGRVLVSGGASDEYVDTASAEIYDPAANTWTLAGHMLEARSDHTMSLLKDGRVLIAGGHSLEIFDPASGTFSAAGTLDPDRTQHAAATLADGRVVIAGGLGESGAIANVDIFDISEGLRQAGSLSAARAALSATTLADGRVLFAGGRNESGDLAAADLYDPVAGVVGPAPASLGAPRSGHRAFLLPNNNRVLIVGGISGGAALSSAELYVPWRSAVRATASMANLRADLTGGALTQDGMLIVTSGLTGSGYTSGSEIYGFATIKTDRHDYAPGSTVNINGSGWVPGETVHLDVSAGRQSGTRLQQEVVADENGNIAMRNVAPAREDRHVRLYLTARGERSEAQTTFSAARH